MQRLDAATGENTLHVRRSMLSCWPQHTTHALMDPKGMLTVEACVCFAHSFM